ncbi:sulfite oxidase heme-binding subunit YedZ [Polymorphum gilvum]|uniref:Protein-methionine-sulfoxide reductase heme-binding subunit MsrQ n=1 Tax=Polymorphum gilvum (strain LMG 25793 / CGMCC 1.9160 / SL003B-26A1) TaxID=991905 RepID=F2IZH0_POLGS|nr:protein-methionine-sulfoxide reductase heme-binding subunit MsrQ [Polymorphum gilvum]ADZ68593.1 Ferric reductase domain protein protein transmembrane component domain protein [Polymorphum gilvum SL003B-26A1]
MTAVPVRSLRPCLPWTDRSGRLSPLRLAVFVAALAPGLWLAGRFGTGGLGPEPLKAALHGCGDWAVRFLFATLAVTPLMRIAALPRLVAVRRMLGLVALAYASAHVLLYVASERWALAKVAAEIVQRPYLAIGFAALAVLAVLGATSTDGAVRRLGPAWHRLHRLAYLIAVLASLHFFLQAKADVFEPTVMAGLFLLLLLWRAGRALGLGLSRPPQLVGLAAVAAVATAGLEYAWYALATGIPAERVLLANADPAAVPRPAALVLLAGLALAALPVARGAVRRFVPAG